MIYSPVKYFEIAISQDKNPYEYTRHIPTKALQYAHQAWFGVDRRPGLANQRQVRHSPISYLSETDCVLFKLFMKRLPKTARKL